MSWLKQIPDDELLDVAEGVLGGLAGAVKEIRAAKLEYRFGSVASEKRYEAAEAYLLEKYAKCKEVWAELTERGLKLPPKTEEQ